jgi:hypothetical protein
VIHFLPAYHETLVLPLTVAEVFERLSAATSSQGESERQIIFNGWVKEDRFRVSIRQRRPSNYIPLVTGQVEFTSRGCIIFTDYKLFPAVRLFVTFWSLLIVIGSIVIGFQYSNVIYTLVGLGILALILWIVWSNFKLQVTPTRKVLLDTLT